MQVVVIGLFVIVHTATGTVPCTFADPTVQHLRAEVRDTARARFHVETDMDGERYKVAHVFDDGSVALTALHDGHIVIV